MKKRFVTTGLLAGLVAGTGAGLILEQTGFVGASNTAAVVDTDTGSATDTGTDSDRAANRAARLTEVLQPLVDDGTITADQLAKVVDALEAAGPVGGPGGPFGHGHGGHRGRGPVGEAAATALGMTVEELHTALHDGTTIAELATANGVDVQTVIDVMIAEATTRLNERVAAGGVTQAEADARLAEITTRITDVVNNGRPDRSDDDTTDSTTAATTAG